MKKAIIDIRDMKRNFQMGNETVHALKGINLTIREGEFNLRMFRLHGVGMAAQRHEKGYRVGLFEAA